MQNDADNDDDAAEYRVDDNENADLVEDSDDDDDDEDNEADVVDAYDVDDKKDNVDGNVAVFMMRLTMLILRRRLTMMRMMRKCG